MMEPAKTLSVTNVLNCCRNCLRLHLGMTKLVTLFLLVVCFSLTVWNVLVVLKKTKFFIPFPYPPWLINVTQQYIFSDDMISPITADPDNNTEFELEFFGLDDNIFSNASKEVELPPAKPAPPRRKNVLFIMADDLRPQLGAYAGDNFPSPSNQIEMHTPNLDKLAAQSLLLKRAYVQFALCGPSRTSMLTSRRPDTTRVFTNQQYWRKYGGNFTTLPQFFKEKGYNTHGIGKIFHQGKVSSNKQDPLSWSEEVFEPEYTDKTFYGKDQGGAGFKIVGKNRSLDLPDESAVDAAKQFLREAAPLAIIGSQPFFLGLGFFKPHLNFICPEKFFKLYKEEMEPRYLTSVDWQTPVIPDGCKMANSTTIDGEKHLTDRALRGLRRAYFACVSYVDSLVGEVLKELDNLGLASNTIVSFTADHGYHLGEQGHWEKSTNHEIATHVPMMIRIPGSTDKGIVSSSIVEAVDLYPTIVSAAGLGPMPECPYGSTAEINWCTQGKNLMPLVDNPDQIIKPAAYSQVKGFMNFMQYSVRMHRYRCMIWAMVRREKKKDGVQSYHLMWNPPGYERELYDLELDPEEQINISYNKIYRKVREKLEKMIMSFFHDMLNVTRIKKAVL